MASSHAHSLKALVVFKNIMYPELLRTVHVYQLEDGREEEVEREYLLHEYSAYEETGFYRVLTLETFSLSAQFEGQVNGIWLCIYVFDADRHCPSDLNFIPAILSISRNPKLAAIPTLANDLQIIFQMSDKVENGEALQIPPTEMNEESSGSGLQLIRNECVFPLDLNLPCPESENEGSGPRGSGLIRKKRRRATTKDVAGIALADLAQYFDLPIAQASKNLKVGLTVLKRKCREFGIPRWPHRKIKSLDSLIHDLQEEAERQKKENEAAATAVAKRQRMLESEKESIERKPFMEIQMETKKFRQDIFKRRHRARARENHNQIMPVF